MKEKELKLLRGEEIKQIKKVSETKKLKCKCDHRNAKGNSKLRETGEEGIYRCEICREYVDTNPIDLEELKEAATVIKNAIQCIKAGYRGKDDVILDQLGFMILGLDTIPSWYKNVFLEKIAENNMSEKYSKEEGINGAMFINTPNYGNFEFAGGKKHKKKNHKGRKKHKKSNPWD